MSRASAALVLALRFAVEVVRAGLSTAWWILHPRRPASGFVRIGYAGLSEFGVVVLGCLVTLTPGTTLVDIDAERQELLVHLLDARDPQAVADEVWRVFVLPLQRLHPARGRR